VRDFLNSAVGQLLTLIDDPNLEQDIKECLEKDELKLFVAFYDLPMYSGIFDLRADKLGQLITIRGTVTRTTDMKPELLVGTFVCNDCNHEVSGVEQQFKVTMPALCRTRGCGNKTNWTLKPEARTTRWGDWQRIRLQENEQEMKAGSMPRSIDIIVRDETCERCKPGDKVKITGCLIVVPHVPSMMNPAELKKQDRRTIRHPVIFTLSPGLHLSQVSSLTMISMDLGMDPAFISCSFSCNLMRCQSPQRVVRASGFSVQFVLLPHPRVLHKAGIVTLNCCSTPLTSWLQSLHTNVPTSNSGFMSVVLVTVPRIVINCPNLSALRSKIPEYIGKS
jgi:hypothetical protein